MKMLQRAKPTYFVLFAVNNENKAEEYDVICVVVQHRHSFIFPMILKEKVQEQFAMVHNTEVIEGESVGLSMCWSVRGE